MDDNAKMPWAVRIALGWFVLLAIACMEPTNEGGMMRASLNSPILNSLILGSNSDVSPKGDLTFCGRSLYNGKPVYFIVKHRNYTGPEDEIISGPFFWEEKEVESYVKRIDSWLQIKRCPCGCWESLDNKRHFVCGTLGKGEGG